MTGSILVGRSIGRSLSDIWMRKRAVEKVVQVLSGELTRYPCNKSMMK